MFHYRWHFKPDIENAGRILPLYVRVDLTPEVLDAQAEEFAKRQINRLPVVESNETTAPVVEESYARFLELLELHLQGHPFIFGKRPASANFAMMGQLTCLTHFDPTPTQLCERLAPRVYAWVERLEDLSGYEVEDRDWMDNGKNLPECLLALLSEVARTHMPQLIANGRAVEERQEVFHTEIDGKAWVQPSFPYQFKCLRWIRDEFRSLPVGDQATAIAVLETTGLTPLVEETANGT